MRQSTQILKLYEELVAELEKGKPTSQWKLERRIANNMLKSFDVQIQYQNARAKHGAEDDSGISPEDRKNVKTAIELRRNIYRMMKEIKENGALSTWP